MVRKLLTLALMCSVLGACTTTPNTYSGKTSDSPTRKVAAKIADIKPLRAALACMKPALQGKRVAITAWADGTGKTNSVSDAGTGNFMPGSTSGDFAIRALQATGIIVQDLASVAGEGNLRQLVDPAAQARLASLATRSQPTYYLNGSWTSLDFDRDHSLDIQVAGIGPYLGMQRATMSASVKLVEPGTLTVAGHGDMKFSVFSQQAGLSTGRLFGSTLVTGQAGVGYQQPMQLWSGEYVATLSTAMALANLPGVPRDCGAMLDKIVGADVISI